MRYLILKHDETVATTDDPEWAVLLVETFGGTIIDVIVKRSKVHESTGSDAFELSEECSNHIADIIKEKG